MTTAPELGNISGNRVVFVGTGRLLGASDLVDPATLIPAQPFAYNQSLYALKDKGTAYGNPRNDSAMVQQTIIMKREGVELALFDNIRGGKKAAPKAAND